MTVSPSSRAASAHNKPTPSATNKTPRTYKRQHQEDTNSSPEPISPIGSSFSDASTSSNSKSNSKSNSNGNSNSNSNHSSSCSRKLISNAASMVTKSASDSQETCHQNQPNLLATLGPRMQTLLHKTIGSTSNKTHRRLQSEVNVSWLPKSDHSSPMPNGAQLKQSQSLLYLKSHLDEQQQQQPPKRSKCVRMKLFHQRIDKLFNQRHLKQWNETVRQTNNTFSDNPERRRRLELETIPEPIRNLLILINSRGPSTEGIFRKSPSAKHCKELRLRLESDCRSSIEEFQVTVVASVFKEWLRSLPDCLLMSRLYPQWIDVAKLIERLQQQQQQKQQPQQAPAHLPSCNQQAPIALSRLGRHFSQQLTVQQAEVNQQGTATGQLVADDDRDSGDDSRLDKDELPSPSLRPSRGSLAAACRQPLDRARSCSMMPTDHQRIGAGHLDDSDVQQVAIGNTFDHCNRAAVERPWRSLASFKLSERRSECLRFIRQLLDNLNDSNLILLRTFMSVLYRIASNSKVNKMSASNLGVCVGQSLLNDEQQPYSFKGSVAGKYNFSRRLRRSRSYSILSSTFSQSNPNLKIDTAQETAKYVPILVTFMIENARQLFGSDIVDLLPADHQESHPSAMGKDITMKDECDEDSTLSCSKMDESRNGRHSTLSLMDQVDGCQANSFSLPPSVLDSTRNTQPTMRHLLVVNNQPVVLASPNSSDKHHDGAYSISVYSSANSSSTSGVHSESPAFSSEPDESQNSGSTRSSVSLASSMLSSPSSSPIEHPPDSQTHSGQREPKDTGQRTASVQSHEQQQQQQLSPSPLRCLYHYNTLASSTPRSRHRNSLPPNGLSPLMSSQLLNGVPKLPVCLSTSSYGGEAIIYNPKPRNNESGQYCVVCPHDSGLGSPLKSQDGSQHLDESRVITVAAQDRLDQYLVQQPQRRLLTSAPAVQQDHQHPQRQSPSESDRGAASDLAALRQMDSASISARQRLLHHSSMQPPIESIYYATQRRQHSALNYPILSSSANLNSLQSSLEHQQQAYYSSLMCCSHRDNFIEPTRSHVMSLRDYYLSLQQRRQQQQNSYTLHRHSQLMRQNHETAQNEPQISNQRSQQQQPLLSSSQYYDHKKQQQSRVQGVDSDSMRRQQHYKLAESSHLQMAADSHLHRQQQQGVAADGLLGAQQQQQAALALMRPLPLPLPQHKLARARQSQSAILAVRVCAPKEVCIGQTKMSRSSDHSSGNSSDSSDDSSSEWTESTMV